MNEEDASFAAVSEAMTRLEPWVPTHDESEVETILYLLWHAAVRWEKNR